MIGCIRTVPPVVIRNIRPITTIKIRRSVQPVVVVVVVVPHRPLPVPKHAGVVRIKVQQPSVERPSYLLRHNNKQKIGKRESTKFGQTGRIVLLIITKMGDDAWHGSVRNFGKKTGKIVKRKKIRNKQHPQAKQHTTTQDERTRSNDRNQKNNKKCNSIYYIILYYI